MSVQGALGALAAMVMMPGMAHADGDEDVAALVSPTNSVEIGIASVSDKSAKFGEYNGLNKDGASLIGNFGIRGGDAYGRGTGATRWSVTGVDLGTDSRELGATVSEQGKWNVGFGYDELKHNITDSYQTPYQGIIGGNNFTLPNGFGVINTTGPSTAQIQALHSQDVYSKRENTSLNGGVNFNDQWGLTFDFKHINQTGAKLISTATDTDVLNGITWKGEGVAMLMNPTVSQTNNFNLALNWRGAQGYATVGYYGSLYHDDNVGFSWANPFLKTAGAVPTVAGLYPTDTMSTPPSNQFHQINMTGGYGFSPATKLVGGLSYARNTQNEGYGGMYTNTSNTGSTYISGPNSLDAKVIMKHADLKLTQQVNKDLNLGAGYKYNERDNQTASNQYTFYILGDPAGGAAGLVPVTNTPMSWKHTQYDLTGDYRISSAQHLRVGYNYDEMKRWCNNDATNVAAGFYTQTSCAQVPSNKENKIAIDYRASVSDTVNLKMGYSYGKRKTDDLDIASTYKNVAFYNPIVGNGAYENTGFVAFFQTSRKEDQYKLGVSWQAADRLSIDASAKYGKDSYDSTYGVQKGSKLNVNLDATYAYSDKNSVNGYITMQNQKRDLYEYKTTTQWFTNNLTDDAQTFGLGAKQKDLMGGKWELTEDLTYSLDKTKYNTQVVAGTACANSGACGAFPTIRSALTALKLTGGYKLDKVSKVILGYQYQHLKSEDATYYQYYQAGYKTSVIPSNQQAPTYNQNVIFAAYNYSFK